MTVRGAGRPVLLLHGYLSDSRSFYYQIEALEQNGYRAIAPDFPGFGTSVAPDGAWSVGDYADWLARLIEKMKIAPPYLLAHSFGARVAFKLLANDAHAAQKLLVTGGAGLVKPRSPEYMRQVKRYRLVKKFFPRYAEKHFGSEEYRSLSPMMKESYKKIVNEDLRRQAEKIAVPALLVYGASDSVTPADEEGRVFCRCISGSRLQIIDGGHFCFSENASVFNRLMLDFFAEDN